MIRFSALKDRFVTDSAPGGTGATPAIARALNGIGWRAIREPSTDELAGYLVYVFEACVHEHRDVSALVHAIAEVLRDTGPLLDGGLPPAEAYYDAAEELVRRYVDDSGRDTSTELFSFDELH